MPSLNAVFDQTLLNNTIFNKASFNKTSASMMEQIGNRVLNLDAEASQQLGALKEKMIRIEILDLELSYDFLFPAQTLVVLNRSERQPAAVISGNLSAFLAAASAENSSDSIFTGELHFSGEINTARQFQQLTQSLDIDWRQPLSELFGDVGSHFIAEGLLKISTLAKSIVTNLRQDIPEYLQEEIKTTPSNPELESFYDKVDSLRSQVDRLSARIAKLTTHA